MGEGLKNTTHIYSQFTDIFFRPQPKTQNICQDFTLINMHIEDLFRVYINDHIRATPIFEAIYIFLHNSYFSRVVFGPVYSSGKKTKAFIDILELLKFQKSCSGLTFLAKHRNKIEQIIVPKL